MPDLQFVVSSGIPERASSTARSHAVRHGLQSKCRADPCTSLQDSRLTIRQKSTLKTRFRVVPRVDKPEKDGGQGRLKKGKKAPEVVETRGVVSTPITLSLSKRITSGPVLYRQPGQSVLDTFDIIPFFQTRGVNNLIKFFLSRLELDISNIQIQRLWWGFAMSDPLVLHTSLGIAAVTWALSVPDPKQASKESFRQKAMALSGIQQRLERNDKSNAMIVAISNLAMMESLSADFKAAQTHMQGVELILQSRGGFETMKSELNVGPAINWPDLVVAVGIGVRPSIPLIQDMDSVTLKPEIWQAAKTDNLSHLEIFESSHSPTSIEYTFSLTRLAQAVTDPTNPLPDHNTRVLYNAAEFRLANLYIDLEEAPMSRILVVAAQLFLHYVIRGTQPTCLLPSILIPRMAGIFKSNRDQIVSSTDHWPGMMWSLFMGMMCSPWAGEDRLFYYVELRNMMSTADIQNPGQLRRSLRNFLWDDQMCEMAFNSYLHALLPNAMV